MTMESLSGFNTTWIKRLCTCGFWVFMLGEVGWFGRGFFVFISAANCPRRDIGLIWPPVNVLPPDIKGLPLLMTAILLSSSITANVVRKMLLSRSYTDTYKYLLYTILLGVYFLTLQVFEFLTNGFSIQDTIYGSTFYFLTGTHMIHIQLGLIWLISLLYYHHNKWVYNLRCLSVTLGIKYWHIIDIAWIFVYRIVYIWGRGYYN